METVFVDTRSSLINLVDSLVNLAVVPPALYIDIEGENLSRHGTIVILQICIRTEAKVYLIDVHTLGKDTFSTNGANGQSLKSVFESDATPKVFFDVRNDSDALYSHFGIKLACIHDLQLMELATRGFPRKYVNGLTKCIENDTKLTFTEKSTWRMNKERGSRLFDPNKGGSYAVFASRPLSDDIKLYCAQDVACLPELWSTYYCKLNKGLWNIVLESTKIRVAESHSPTYNDKGRHKALGPWTELQQRSWRDLDQTRLVLNPSAPSKPTDGTRQQTISTLSVTPNDHERQRIHDVSYRLGVVDLNDWQKRAERSRLDDDYDDDVYYSNDGFEDVEDLFGSESDQDLDYTACSAEDCGYCGHCSY